MHIGLLCSTFTDILSYAFYILIALVVLLVMITIHEFGHFIVGKKLGFKINEFAIGFGKILLKHTTKDGILVTLRLIPLGGYCAFEGEDEDVQTQGSFNSMAPWKRLLVLFSGAFFNFISAVIMSFVLLVSIGYADVVQVNSIKESASASNVSQMQVGDVIYKVDGVETNFLYDNYFQSLMATHLPGEDVTLTVKRNGEFVDIVIQNGSEIDKTEISSSVSLFSLDNENFITVTISGEQVVFKDAKLNELEAKLTNKGEREYLTIVYDGLSYIYDVENGKLYTNFLGISVGNYVYSFGEALVKCVPFTCEWAWKVLTVLWMLITGQMGIDGLGGPITTISQIATHTQTNWLNLLILFPLISVNLAVFNWLPFPALDGARMVFVVIEWIRGKPINRNVEGYIHTAGLIILFAFVILVDVIHLLF